MSLWLHRSARIEKVLQQRCQRVSPFVHESTLKKKSMTRFSPSTSSRWLSSSSVTSSKTKSDVFDISSWLTLERGFLVIFGTLGSAGAYKHFFQSPETSLKHRATNEIQSNEKLKSIVGSPILCDNFVRVGQEHDSDASVIEFSFDLKGTKGKATAYTKGMKNDTSGKWTMNILSVTLDEHLLIENQGPGVLDLIGHDSSKVDAGNDTKALLIPPEDRWTRRVQNDDQFIRNAVLVTLSGIFVGCLAGVRAIKHLKTRGSYVYKLAMQKLDQHKAATDVLGLPIKSTKADYSGEITPSHGIFKIKVRGSKQEGTLHVNAFKDSTTDEPEWKFSYLALDVAQKPTRLNLLK